MIILYVTGEGKVHNLYSILSDSIIEILALLFIVIL